MNRKILILVEIIFFPWWNGIGTLKVYSAFTYFESLVTLDIILKRLDEDDDEIEDDDDSAEEIEDETDEYESPDAESVEGEV